MLGAPFRLGGCVLGFGLVLSGVAAAQSPKVPEPPSAPPAADGKRLETWLAGQRDPYGRPCDRRAAISEGTRTVLACGEAGLWIVRDEGGDKFVLVGTQDLGGDVIGLFQRDDSIWAEISKLEARPVLPSAAGSTGTTSAAALPDVSPAPRSDESPAIVKPPLKKVDATADTSAADELQDLELPRRPEGVVVELGVGDVVIDLGKNDGLKHGDRVELTAVTSERVGRESAKRRHVVAVGVVTAVSEGFSRVRLGINERVPLGATATRVDGKETNRRLTPPRPAGLWEVEFMARPFLALGELGGGFLLDASAGYRFESDLHVELAFRPFGWGTGEGKPSITPVTSFAKVSYDRDLFEVGLGFGLQTVNITGFGSKAGTGTLFSQGARIGARDGLHFDARSDVVLFHSRFEFTGFVGSGQIPVGQTSWLILEGGGGSSGYGYGEIGVRVLLTGNGDRGSVFFNGSVGGVAIIQEQELTCGGEGFTFTCFETTTYAGPMLGAGAEWRF
jgi:hypothetical protein